MNLLFKIDQSLSICRFEESKTDLEAQELQVFDVDGYENAKKEAHKVLLAHKMDIENQVYQTDLSSKKNNFKKISIPQLLGSTLIISSGGALIGGSFVTSGLVKYCLLITGIFIVSVGAYVCLRATFKAIYLTKPMDIKQYEEIPELRLLNEKINFLQTDECAKYFEQNTSQPIFSTLIDYHSSKN